jgi:hypothetical protein
VFECTPRNPMQQLTLLWHSSDERGLRVSPSPLAVLNHAQLLRGGGVLVASSREPPPLALDQRGIAGVSVSVTGRAAQCWHQPPSPPLSALRSPMAFSAFLVLVAPWDSWDLGLGTEDLGVVPCAVSAPSTACCLKGPSATRYYGQGPRECLPPPHLAPSLVLGCWR